MRIQQSFKLAVPLSQQPNTTKTKITQNFLTCQEVNRRGEENQHGGNEHNHPVIIRSFLIRKIKSTGKKIRIASFGSTDGELLKPWIAAERPLCAISRKHNVQTNDRRDNNSKGYDGQTAD